MAINPPSTTISPASQSPRRADTGDASPSGQSTPALSSPNAPSAAQGAMQPLASGQPGPVAGEDSDVATQRSGIDAVTPPRGPTLLDQLGTMRRLSHAESRSELIEFIQVLGTMLDVGPYQSETFAGRDPQLGQVEGVRVAVAGAFHALMGGRPADLWVHAIKIDKALDKAFAEAGTPRGRDRATQSKSFGIMAGILSTNVLSLTSIADSKEKKEAETGWIEGGKAGEIATYLEPILAEVSPFEIHKAAERLGMSNEDIILATTYFMQAVSTGHLTNKLDLNLCQPFMRLLIEADVKFDPNRCWPQASEWGQ